MIEIDLKSRYYILFYFRYENETGLGFFFLQEEFIFSINHKKKKQFWINIRSIIN